MIKAIETANDLVRRYSQIKTPNELTDQIQKGIVLNQDQACETAEGICKAVTFWIEAYSKDLIDMPFGEFYGYCCQKGYITKSDMTDLYTWVALSIEDLADKFDISVDRIKDFRQLERFEKDEWLGTVRKFRSWHSMIAFRNMDGKLRLSDTWNRGIDKPFFDYINEDNFKYLTIMGWA